MATTVFSSSVCPNIPALIDSLQSLNMYGRQRQCDMDLRELCVLVGNDIKSQSDRTLKLLEDAGKNTSV
jgi:predicted ATPase